MKQFFLAFVINILILLLFLAGGEWFLRNTNKVRTASAVGIPIYQSDPLRSYAHQPGSNARNGYGDPPPEIYIDAQGLRTSESAQQINTDSSDKKVLLLGDSFTFGTGLAYEETFAGILDEKYTVYNAGVVGHTTDQYYLALKEFSQTVDLDAVVINFFTGNDLTEHRRHKRFYEDGDLTRVEDLKITVQDKMLYSKDRIEPSLYVIEFLIDRWDILVAKLFHTTPSEPTLTWPAYLTENHPAQDPQLETYWNLSEKDLQQIQDYCKKNSIELLITIIPMDVQIDMNYLKKYPNAPFTVADYDAQRPQQRLNTFCATQKIECLDLLPAFRAFELKDELYFQNEDPHFDVLGHQLTAQLIESILESGLESGLIEYE